MNSRYRGLTTFAAAAAIVSLTCSPSASESEAQNAVPNAESNRFTPSTLRVDPETDDADGNVRTRASVRRR